MNFKICSNCNCNYANSGRNWCEQCFRNQSFRNQKMCTKCNHNPANPGRNWCEQCFRNQNMSPMNHIICTKCNHNPANPGRSWCEQCFRNQNMSPMCSNCHHHPVNPGYNWCQQCYNASKISINNNNNKILFYDKNKPYYEFTNFQEGYPFLFNNKMWKTSEHYFQAMKFNYYAINQQELNRLMDQIQNATSARQAFDIAQANSNLVRSDWLSIRDNVMRDALKAKFTSHSVLKNLLKSTGNAVLVEDSKKDSYWGIGNGHGENKLGKLLMELRSTL